MANPEKGPGKLGHEGKGNEKDPAIRAGAWRGISRYRIDRGEIEAALDALQTDAEVPAPQGGEAALLLP